jgi:hypothetical protein
VQQRTENQKTDDYDAAAAAPSTCHHRQPFPPGQPDFVTRKPA